MDAKQLNQTFDLVSLVSGLVNLRKSGAYFIGACPICGGRDRFQIKRTGTGDAWICRKCNPRYHTVIDFFILLNGGSLTNAEDFKKALQQAGGETQAPRRAIGTGKPVRAPAPVQVLPSETWQRDAWQKVDAACNRLIRKETGEAGRRYLAARGISRGSIFMHLLGYDPAKYDVVTKTKRPAIVIPWLDVGEVVTFVKYRFIDELAQTDKDKRFIALGGSTPYLFGLQHILDSDETLLFTEGELNTISILQTLPRGVSVISGGGDTNGNAPLLQALAKQYKRVVIWTDEPSKARAIRERMNRPEARLLKSPVVDGVKYDASRMLQDGLLMEFISAELSAPCDGVPVAAQLEQVTA